MYIITEDLNVHVGSKDATGKLVYQLKFHMVVTHYVASESSSFYSNHYEQAPEFFNSFKLERKKEKGNAHFRDGIATKRKFTFLQRVYNFCLNIVEILNSPHELAHMAINCEKQGSKYYLEQQVTN